MLMPGSLWGTKVSYLSIQQHLFNIHHLVGTRLGASDTDGQDILLSRDLSMNNGNISWWA